jgi:hypothetical protein
MSLHFPLLILVLIAYNLLVFLTGVSLEANLFTLTMVSGAVWSFKVSDVLLLFALILLFFEILKATRTGAGAVIDHLLSTGVFIIALVEFILVAQAATTTFFLIMVITLLDVIAGFSVSITSARRDFSVGGPDSFG